MVKIAAKARKVGNSFVITIPTDLSNQLELILDKLNEESIKERELRAKYDYYSKDGEIYLDKKKIGTVDSIFFSIRELQVAETNGMGRLDWKKAEIIPAVFGLMTGRLFASKMYLLFGKRATDYDLIIPLDIHITITDKDKNKIHMKIQERQYNLKDDLEFKLRKFNHAKVIEKKLVEK